MYIELPKNQKKKARELIQMSLEKECKEFLSKMEKLLQKPDSNNTQHELYLELYKEIHSFDKHLSHRYDDLGGSRYFITLLGLYIDEVLTAEDIKVLDEDLQKSLIQRAKLSRNEEES